MMVCYDRISSCLSLSLSESNPFLLLVIFRNPKELKTLKVYDFSLFIVQVKDDFIFKLNGSLIWLNILFNS